MSPEAESIVRQIFATQLVEHEGSKHFHALRAEFGAALAFHMGEWESPGEPAISELFGGMVDACQRLLNAAIEAGVLSAHEAKSGARHRIIMDTLGGIQKSISILSKSPLPDRSAILQFEEKYRNQVADRHRSITPPHFDAARKLPIDNIYVLPDILRSPKKKEEEPTVLPVDRFLSIIHRTVLLGNPGGGKSTLALKVCHDLATRYPDRLCGNRLLTPILVVLRDYGAEKKRGSLSILQFIQQAANSTYQIAPPAGAFEYLMTSGRVMVVFDGMDELLDSSYRQQVSGDVESFCALYPAVPVLVTSREVGYEEAPLDPKRFQIFRLAPFNEEQVREYASKWFSADEDLSPDQQARMADSFFEESRIVPDLRSNPLMLGLMCNIYRGESYIPSNRPDIYEKCAVMLFEKWDKRRAILVPLPFEAHVRPAMEFLAHWIHSDEKLQSGVTEEFLVGKASDYLMEWVFDDFHKAQHAAREFIEFCRGRAWVFTDTGTTRAGERLYQFTHRTFLEYFTAAYLVRTNPTPQMLLEKLLTRIVKREWDVVAQLAFQIQHKAVQGAGDALLLGLLEKAATSALMEAWNLLSFGARCLEFMVPRPRVIRRLATECLERTLRWALLPSSEKRRAYPVGEELFGFGEQLIGDLLCCARENQATVFTSVEGWLIQRINQENENESLAAIEISATLPFLPYRSRARRVASTRAEDQWEEVSQRIFREADSRIEGLRAKNFRVCLESFWHGILDVQELVRLHGVSAIFRPSDYGFLEGFWRPSAAEALVLWLMPHPYSRGRLLESDVLENLRQVATLLLGSPPPWLTKRYLQTVISTHLFEHGMDKGSTPSNAFAAPDVMFASVLLLGTELERAIVERIEATGDLIRALRENCPAFFEPLLSIILARFDAKHELLVEGELERWTFSPEQKQLLRQWARKEVNFVAPHRSRKS